MGPALMPRPRQTFLHACLCCRSWESSFASVRVCLVGCDGFSTNRVRPIFSCCVWAAPPGAIAAFRMADTRDLAASASAAMLLVTLSAALASFRRTHDAIPLRVQLVQRHRDGIAIGTLCVPIVAGVVLIGNPHNGPFSVFVVLWILW